MRRLIRPLLIAVFFAALFASSHPPRPHPERTDPGQDVEDSLPETGYREGETLWQRRYREWFSGLDPETRLQIVRQEYERHKSEEARPQLAPADAAPAWTTLGPTNGAGRLTAIAFPRDDLQTIYVGAETGGVWKSTDSGASWLQLTDSIPSLEVGSLAVAPSSPNLIYLGSGAGRFGGIGLIKSTDAGATWQLPSTVVGGNIWAISVHPGNPNELVIGTDIGAYRSIDGGSTWSQVISALSYGVIHNVIRDPTNSAVLYATSDRKQAGQNYVAGVVLKSTDAGLTWAEKTQPLSFYRIAIAIAPSAPQVLYISVVLTPSETSRDLSTHVLKSTDAGETWTDLPSAISNITGGIQTTHNNAIVVSPNDPNVVMVGGVFYLSSKDGGATWNPPSFSGSSVHPDCTQMRYHGSTLLIANDGGLWSSPDNGSTSASHNAGLVVRQYYTVASDPGEPFRFIAGCQDNGTDVRQATGGFFITAPIGDGFDCAITGADPPIAYATAQYGTILRGPLGATGISFQSIRPAYGPDDPAPFATLLKMDPGTPTSLYTATKRVWRTTDGGTSWNPLPTTTTDGSAFENEVMAGLAVGRAGQILMVHNGLSMFRSIDGGMTWRRASLPPPAVPLQIEIDSNDAATAYAVIAPLTPGQPNFIVSKTTDGGATWHPSNNGLPATFLVSLRVDPSDSNIIYCGTSTGVYRSTDRGATWSSFTAGLPNVPVTSFSFSSDGSLLRAATFGRGIWQIQVRPSQPDYFIGFDQPVLAAERGTKVPVTLLIARTGGFSQSVTVTPPAPAQGIKPKPPDPITTSDSNAVFKLKISGAASPGQYQLVFTARDDTGRARTATLTLVVQ